MSYLNIFNLIVGTGAVVTFLTLLRQQRKQQDAAQLRRIRVESQRQLERFRQERRQR